VKCLSTFEAEGIDVRVSATPFCAWASVASSGVAPLGLMVNLHPGPNLARNCPRAHPRSRESDGPASSALKAHATAGRRYLVRATSPPCRHPLNFAMLSLGDFVYARSASICAVLLCFVWIATQVRDRRRLCHIPVAVRVVATFCQGRVDLQLLPAI
jgi:hypothetical protein